MQKRKKPLSAGCFLKLQKSKLCATRAPFAGLVQRFEIQIRIGSLTGRIACQSRTWITVGEGGRGHSLQGWTGKLFFSRGRARRGKAKNLWGPAGQGTTPFPQCRTGRGRGQICRAGWGWGGEHTECISWLKSYAAEKEILICIALSEVNFLKIHGIDRN